MRPHRLLRQQRSETIPETVRPNRAPEPGQDRPDTVRPQPDGEVSVTSATSAPSQPTGPIASAPLVDAPPTYPAGPALHRPDGRTTRSGPPGRTEQDMPMPRQAPQISQELQRPEADPADEAARAVEDANSSWALVEACQAGDAAAFGELYERYHDVVYRYVLFRMGDRSFAEDVTQETFVRALRRISSVSYQGRDIGAWFVTIARNLIFDYVKSSRFRLEQTTSEIVELSPSTGGPEQQVLDMATNDELLASIAKLNSDQRECIQYRFLKGLSVAETAELMDRNEGAVKALQHRAVRRLAQLLPDGLR
jgi:RNA polymerase sigma-70 factor (ECF subfamily)